MKKNRRPQLTALSPESMEMLKFGMMYVLIRKIERDIMQVCRCDNCGQTHSKREKGAEKKKTRKSITTGKPVKKPKKVDFKKKGGLFG